jgi:repressor LexA
MTTTAVPKPITARQREVYVWIANYVAERGYSPTFREIAKAFGWKSANAVVCHLVPLRKKGFLTWEEGAYRTIRCLKGGAE